jgi:hypothetical protein
MNGPGGIWARGRRRVCRGVRCSPAATRSRDVVEAEIESFLVQVRGNRQLQPNEVNRQLAGQSARLTELWIHLHRVEGSDRTLKQVRTTQVGPLFEETVRQCRVASRQFEARRQDLDTARGFSCTT